MIINVTKMWIKTKTTKTPLQERLDTGSSHAALHPKAGSSRVARDERGSSLILALVFLIVSSLIVLSLANFAKNDLINTAQFSSAQSLESAANSAAELAVNSIRYNFVSQTLNASPPEPCWTPSPTPSQVTLNGQSVAVWCRTLWTPLSPKTRVVTFMACQSGISALACATAPLLEAVVTFDDYPIPMGAVSTAQCTTTCGVGMTINSWVFDAVPPVVQSISPTTGPTAGGTTVTITGSGFTSGAIVDLVGTNFASNVVVAASSVVVASPTTITAVTPALASGVSYYVAVVTATGTSVYGPTFN